MDEHKLTSAEFNNELTTIDWSSNGKFLVLGDNQGFVHIMNAKNLEVKDNTSKLWKVGVKEVLDLKIDPKSNFVAYTNQGASAGKISILKVGNSMDLAPHATINLGKECAIVNFDWSSDSRYL
jgi:WD40 repeat protein